MNNTFQIYLISDSTGETLDRIFLALKAQFKNFNYKAHQYSFTRTENQILKILEISKKEKNSIVLYTIVDKNLANFLLELTKISSTSSKLEAAMALKSVVVTTAITTPPHLMTF